MVWALSLAAILAFGLLIQTLRIVDLKQTERSLRIGTDNLVSQRERYYTEKHDAIRQSETWKSLYHDSCNEVMELRDKAERLEEKIKFEEEGWKLSLSRREAAVKYLTDRIENLERQKILKSQIHLVDGLEDLMRFVAANQWLMEEHRAFAEVVASVGEVAESITERED